MPLIMILSDRRNHFMNTFLRPTRLGDVRSLVLEVVDILGTLLLAVQGELVDSPLVELGDLLVTVKDGSDGLQRRLSESLDDEEVAEDGFELYDGRKRVSWCRMRKSRGESNLQPTRRRKQCSTIELQKEQAISSASECRRECANLTHLPSNSLERYRVGVLVEHQRTVDSQVHHDQTLGSDLEGQDLDGVGDEQGRHGDVVRGVVEEDHGDESTTGGGGRPDLGTFRVGVEDVRSVVNTSTDGTDCKQECENQYSSPSPTDTATRTHE